MLYLVVILVLTLFEWLIWLIWLMKMVICCVCVCICNHFDHINSKWNDLYLFLLWLYWSIDQLRNNIHCCYPCFRNHVLVQFKYLLYTVFDSVRKSHCNRFLFTQMVPLTIQQITLKFMFPWKFLGYWSSFIY